MKKLSMLLDSIKVESKTFKVSGVSGKAKEFSAACDDSPLKELVDALLAPPDKIDMKNWQISDLKQYHAAILDSLSRRLLEDEEISGDQDYDNETTTFKVNGKVLEFSNGYLKIESNKTKTESTLLPIAKTEKDSYKAKKMGVITLNGRDVMRWQVWKVEDTGMVFSGFAQTPVKGSARDAINSVIYGEFQ